MVRFHLPQRPYSPIDALNRRAAALGSPRYAQLTSGASYNGHHIQLWWNSYRGYYIAEHYWAGRVVHARGSFSDCLRATLKEYERGDLGSSASIEPREDDADAIALCQVTPQLLPGKEPETSSWWTWQHQAASEAAKDSANPGMLALIFDWQIMQSASSRDEYEEQVRSKHGRCYI